MKKLERVSVVTECFVHLFPLAEHMETLSPAEKLVGITGLRLDTYLTLNDTQLLVECGNRCKNIGKQKTGCLGLCQR